MAEEEESKGTNNCDVVDTVAVTKMLKMLISQIH